MYRVAIKNLTVSLYQTFISTLLAERNTCHFITTSYSYHHFLAARALMNNCFEGWSTRTVTFHQKSLTNTQEFTKNGNHCHWVRLKHWFHKNVVKYPTSFMFSLLCDKRQQWDSLTKWCLTWKCRWSKGVSLLLYAEKEAPIDIHQCLLNVSGDQTVDVSTLRQWVVCFSSSDSNSGHLYWCGFLRVWHAGSCSSLAKIQN